MEQLELSLQLLYLLQWLMERKQDELKKLVDAAVADNYKDKIAQQNLSGDALQYTIGEFLGLLDALLLETLHTKNIQQILAHKLVPALDHLDTNAFDSATLAKIVAKTENPAYVAQPRQAREQLMKEILKQWKPKKNGTIN